MLANYQKKQKIIIISIGVVVIGIIIAIVAFSVNNNDNSVNNSGKNSSSSSSKNSTTKKKTSTADAKIKIVKSEAEKLTLVNYSSSNFTMKIPKGWTVEAAGTGMFYAIRVYDKSDDRYQIYAILKAEPFLKNDKAKAWYENYYNSFGGEGNKALAKAIVLYQPTVEAFYSNFNAYTAYTKTVDTMYTSFHFPDLKNFAMVESFESNSSMKSVASDDKTLRGTFQTSSNKKGEGLFMASVVSPGSYNYTGYDTTYYTVYNVMGITTAKDDLVNYQKLLTESLSSIKYTDSFVKTTINNSNQATQSIVSVNKTISDASSSYNKAWTNRQKSYDISSQKYSDATLGYERVYDTTTGDIYKAYNGFTDDYTGSKYKAVTNDMYTQSITGYIEK